jgi:hypothetical protein
LRIGTGNVEFAGLFAPKPLGLSAADDWTKEMETKGFPELQKLFAMHHAEDHVMLIARTEFKHNYNAVCRAAMYQWFNRHLGLNADEPIRERDYQRLTQEEMTVWNEDHPQPQGGDSFERELLQWWKQDSDRQLRKLTPRDRESWTTFREIVGGAVETIIGRSLATGGDVRFAESERVDRGRSVQRVGLLRNATYGEELPLVILEAKQPSTWGVVWLDSAGKRCLLDDHGKPIPAVQKLLDGGATVVGVDLLFQGEFLADGSPLQTTRRVENPREAAAYTFGYNPTLFAQRTHDVLSVVSYLKNDHKEIALVGLGEAGPWAANARALAGEAIAKTALDTGGFRFAAVQDLHSPDFLFGGAKYGDLPGVLALAAPGKMWLAGEGGQLPSLVRQTYEAAGGSDAVTVFRGPAEEMAEAAASWLLQK